MPLSERARIEIYLPDLPTQAYQDLLGALDRDAFTDALQAARWMIENDFRAFAPHIGITAGSVTAERWAVFAATSTEGVLRAGCRKTYAPRSTQRAPR